MTKYIIRRLVMMIPVLIGVSLLTFLMLHLAPGDPVDILLGDQATPEAKANLRHQLGLDLPLHIQFGRFIVRAVQGDFGRSIHTNQPVLTEIMDRLPYTLELTIASMFIAVVLGVGAGVLAAARQNTAVDNVSMVTALLWVSLPSFWFAVILQLIFSVNFGWLPLYGRNGGFLTLPWLASLVLPAVTLGARSAAILARMTRSSVLEVLRQDYVRTAQAKGLAQKVVLWRHVLKNAFIPVTTVIGLQVGFLLGGAFITETIFAWPGVGRLGVQAIFSRDIPVVQGMVLLVATGFVLINLLVDLVYAWLDPRIRYQ